MNDEEKTLWFAHNFECRAEVLSLVNNIDGFISLQMSQRFSFTREQTQKFRRIFFGAPRINFNSKIDIYIQFLKDYEPDLLENQCRELPSLLDKVKSARNIFAHSSDPMVIDLENIELKDMPFVQVIILKNGQNISQEYTQEQYRELYVQIMKAREMMVLILTAIMNAKNKTASEIAYLIKSKDVSKWVGRACGNCGYRVKEYDKVINDKCPRCKNYDLNGDVLHYGL